MGLKSLFLWAFLGPLAFLSLMWGHTTCRVALQKAPPMRAPAGTVSQEVVKARKVLVEDFVKVLRGRISGKDFGKRYDKILFESRR